jgi:hypothetical protein
VPGSDAPLARDERDFDGELMRLLHHHGGMADKGKGVHFWNDGNGSGLLYPTMLVAAVAVIGFSLFGIATMTGYLPNLLSDSDEAETAPSTSAETVACANCVVISSMHPVAETRAVSDGNAQQGDASRPLGRADRPQSRAAAPHREVHYQIKVHMRDGSYRSFDYGTAPQMAVGQQVKVVDGRIIAGG